VPLYPSGKTGYEKYYSDIFSFWRDIYDPEIVSRVNDYINAANAISN
jgi:hypothetical protein